MMFSKNGSVIWNDVKNLIEEHGEQKGLEIIMEIRNILQARNIFNNMGYDEQQIKEMAFDLVGSILQGKEC